MTGAAETRARASLPMTGGCQCGGLRYVVSALPLVFYHCHCTQCQKQSSSAFGQSLRVAASSFCHEGSFATFTREAASGRHLIGHFCPSCGGRVWHARAGATDALNVKAGTLDDTSWLRPAGHIWTRSAQASFRPAAGDLVYPEQPEDGYAALAARFRAMLSAA